MTEVLLEPVKFFSRVRERPPRPWLGYLVVLAASLLSGLASQLATRNLPSPELLGPGWVWMAIGAVIGSLIPWGLLGFLLHLLTDLGARAFELAGWVFAPGVLTGIALLGVAAIVPVNARLPPLPADPGQLDSWLRGYQATVHASTFSQASRILGVFGVLWGARILYAGARTWAPDRAALATGVFLTLTLGLLALAFFRG